MSAAELTKHFFVPPGRFELPHLAPEANALSSELQGHKIFLFYHDSFSPLFMVSMVNSIRNLETHLFQNTSEAVDL